MTEKAPPVVGFVRLPHGEGLPVPTYHSAAAAGIDLCAACTEPVAMEPGARALVPTGIIVELPHGYEGQIRPRSGLALKHGITCLNTPGTVDADYRGEVMVLLVNLGEAVFTVARGMRIAQMVVAPVVRAQLEERGSAGATDRGGGGFGSTG